MSKNGEAAPIIIRRVRKVVGGGHHGGAWKVAYADFVTAMMAFFLVMWLVGSTTNKEKAAISEYFKNPSAVKGHSASPATGPNGPGGASTSLIKLGGTMEIPRGPGTSQLSEPKNAKSAAPTDQAAKAQAREAERKQLESLLTDLKAAVEKSQALAPFKDQLLLDISPFGMRIQIVDKQNRPMFDLGSAVLKPYTVEILHELAQFIQQVPNKVSISGHTDVTPYASINGYTNWELSADRANAARRALVAGGLSDDRIALVVGLGSAVLFDKKDPTDPINRRISIVVMNEDAKKTMLEESEPTVTTSDGRPDLSGAAPASPKAEADPATASIHAPAAEPPSGGGGKAAVATAAH
jgi:chemotaxis protein MotB